MTILTVLGYLILFLLTWVGLYILVFTASRAWHDGKAKVWEEGLDRQGRLGSVDHTQQRNGGVLMA